MQFLSAEDHALKYYLVTGIGVVIFITFVYVAVKHWEADKKCHTDEVFHTLDICVVIYQSENLFDFAYK